MVWCFANKLVTINTVPLQLSRFCPESGDHLEAGELTTQPGQPSWDRQVVLTTKAREQTGTPRDPLAAMSVAV